MLPKLQKDDQRLFLTLDEHERRIHSLYEAYASFHMSGYKQLLADPEPRLPHFLEIAFQRFLDSSSERSMSTNCRSLLNLLGRTLLFLMLEDVAAADLNNAETESIHNELRSSKPPSDGRLLDFQLKLLRSIDEDNREALVTGNLMAYLPEIIGNHLKPVVTKRNRANHPPFDEDGFLTEARLQLPLAIHALRKAFRTLEILVPTHFKWKKDQLVIRAQTLTGHRFEYPERDFYSELDPQLTPNDTLLLCRVIPNQSQPLPEPRKPNRPVEEEHSRTMDQLESGQRERLLESVSKIVTACIQLEEAHNNMLAPRIVGAVPLMTLFHKKTGYKEMIMAGVFDHIAKEGPVFDYVEETY